MVDASGVAWLIEVNTNPCLEESSPLLQQLVPRMVDDAFKLTVDRVYSDQSKNVGHGINHATNTNSPAVYASYESWSKS